MRWHDRVLKTHKKHDTQVDMRNQAFSEEVDLRKREN